MKDFFNAIRLPLKKVPLFKTAVHTAALFFCGLLTGIAIKLLDLHNPYLGDIFSQLSVWIFLGTVIAVYSSSPKRASVIFFCVGMLITCICFPDLVRQGQGLVRKINRRRDCHLYAGRGGIIIR